MIFDLINNIVFNFDGIYSPGKIDDSEGRFQITRASALKPFMVTVFVLHNGSIHLCPTDDLGAHRDGQG